MRLKQIILALTLISLTIAFLCFGSYRRTEAQNGYVCAGTRTCSGGFPEDCVPNGSTLPAVDIHVAGDWYTDELTGHCGARDGCFGFCALPCGPPRGQRLCWNSEKAGT